MDISKIIIAIGIVVVLGAVLWQFDIKLGNLPGDITVKKRSFNLYLPITTTVTIAVVISLIIYAFTLLR